MKMQNFRRWQHAQHQAATIGVMVIALLLLGSLIPFGAALGQDGSPPTSGDAVASPDAVDAAASTIFTYQGNLKKSGQAVNANCSFQFSLWDALSGGTQKATTQIVNNTQVQAGSFTVQLDFGNQFTGDARWLKTEVQCAGDGGYTTLAPRQPLNAVPYAIGLRPGAVLQSAASGDAFYVEKNAVNSTAIHGKSTQTGGTGIFGESVSWAGVWGQSTGASGVVGISSGEFSGGVYGENTGKGYGVYGKATNSVGVFGDSRTWIGVYGRSANQTGVVGESSSHDGVRGTATAANRIGVKGIANASGAVGVWGESDANTGVFGTSGKGTGVWGQAGGTGTIGVKGVADGTGSVGVWGQSAANTGVYGQSGAASGAALWGKNTAGGIALKAEGRAVQSRDMGGLPKAMVEIDSTGGKQPYIVRCYNGLTGNSSAAVTCGGISAQRPNNYSQVLVDFGFRVDDRFVLVQAVDNGERVEISRYLWVEQISGNTVTVHNQRLDCSSGSSFCGTEQMRFFIFVF
jgi:hypothetical protein